ncbi:hypothetical protein EVJ58_g6153 [Rhodofomes roseus]|uniref:Uncharacterized protein n=1 Tax=Rhodofomes roseus TaxID=34475 RepID=A0A4Y9YB91_9APHY|nr:hypothetical protein EVJ58_g6153 [Rhodofomes roseus]
MVNNPRTVPHNRVDIADQVEKILIGTQAKICFHSVVPLLQAFPLMFSLRLVSVLDKLHANHLGFSDWSAEEREIEAATMDITK